MAHHPQANSVIEWLHQHLKAFLRAHLDGPNWMDELRWVLLGISTTPKKDLGCCSVELAYSSTIMVPGDFIGNLTLGPNLTQLFPCLWDKMQGLKPVPASRHGVTKESVPPDLIKAIHVFIQHDAHCLPLQRPYDDPYRVLTPRNKTFTMQASSREKMISVNRLKPMHVDQDVSVQVAIPPQVGDHLFHGQYMRLKLIRSRWWPHRCTASWSHSCPSWTPSNLRRLHNELTFLQ